MKKWIVFALILGYAAIVSCSHTKNLARYGVQENHASFIPARIAVANCRIWPNGAAYKQRPLSDISSEELQALCERFDQYVIDGFKEQPYMRGLSPRAVAILLNEAGQPDFFAAVDDLWKHLLDDCSQCENPPAFYHASISPRISWQLWLNTFSRKVRNADAILMPMVTFSTQVTVNERGINTALRQAGVVMFLVDTNNASLIWAGGRKAQATNRSLDKVPLMPEWQDLYERLFVDDLWREFPGRQNF